MPEIKYNILTEGPGQKASTEQLERIYHRYRFASTFSKNKSVLEVACGTGIGLEYLASKAENVIGIDIDSINISTAHKTINESAVRDKIKIEQMDAHKLSFDDNSFDLVIIFEAIYYLNDVAKFIQEVYRVLKNNGQLIIGSVNKNWSSFHASPYTHRYFTIPEYNILLSKKFTKIEYFGAFPTKKDSKLFTNIKNLANKFNLIPGSLKAREFLKRLFIGKLVDLPASIQDDVVDYYEPEKITEMKENDDYKIIYTIATKSNK